MVCKIQRAGKRTGGGTGTSRKETNAYTNKVLHSKFYEDLNQLCLACWLQGNSGIVFLSSSQN